MRPRRYVVPAALLVLALGACGGDDPGTPPGMPPGMPPGSAAPAGGTADRPTELEATTDLLDWRPVPGPVGDTVTGSGDWTLTVSRSGTTYSLDGPGADQGGSTSGSRVTETLLDETWAVVVTQDKAEQRPARAEVTELATGRTFTLDGGSDVPTTTGGTWALGEGRLLHATTSGGAYCLASVDLDSRRSAVGWCAPKRHGFTDARVTPAGDSLQTFDDSRPSCRTLVSVAGDRTEPLPGVPECQGWDALLTEDGAVWSVIPNENQVESARLHARVGDGYFDLGPGTAGSLTWCGDAAYFVRDPQRESEPAALMRWSATDGLSVAYESPEGQAFVSEPRCGGDRLTLTALAEGGDEQVTAPVG